MELCWCGTFAIGICRNCGGYVCRDHSSLSDGPRLCSWCSERRTPAGEARRAQLIEQQLEDRRERLEQIARLEDPVERLLSAVRFVLHDMHPDAIYNDPAAQSERERGEFARACPEFCAGIDHDAFRRDEAWVGAWDSREVGVWTARRLSAQGIKPGIFVEEEIRKSLVFREPRLVEVARHACWPIRTCERATYELEVGMDHNYLYVLADGRTSKRRQKLVGPPPGVVYHDRFDDLMAVPECPEITLGDLDAIAHALALPAVEIHSSLPA